LILLPLLVYTLFKKRFRDFFIFLLPVFVFVIWQFCLFSIFGEFGIGTSSSQVGVPLWGFLSSLLDYTRITDVFALHRVLSPLPVLFFCLICLYFLFEDKRYNLYKFILLFNIIFILSLIPKFYSIEGVEGIGRQAIGVYLFSIIYFSKKKPNLIKIFAFLIGVSWIEYVLRLSLIHILKFNIT